MGADAPPPAGLLVVRAWLEGEPPALRARITTTVDVEVGGQQSTYAGETEEVVQIVRDWLDGLLRMAGGDDTAQPP